MPTKWRAVSGLPPLGQREVQIWRADLAELPGDLDIYVQKLSPLEAQRAARHKAGQVRMQFAAARACLRVLLGNLLDLPASEVPLILSASGKPELSPDCGHTLFFNLAHSRETVLIALCRESPVGVDLEYLDRQTNALDIASNYFTPREFRQIQETGEPSARQQAFFRCWTRKEAVVKADGRGLSIPLNSLEVPVLDRAASTPVRIVASGSAPDPETWFVTDLAMGDAIAGAFAAGSKGLETSTFVFPCESLPR
jgi:4'-phosphopantetheinyl transferase